MQAQWFKWMIKAMLSMVGLVILLWLDQVLGQAFFAIVYYLWRVNARPNLFSYLLLTLIAALLISGVTMIPWWGNILILVCANGVYSLSHLILKKSRWSLLLTAVLISIVMEILIQKSIEMMFLLKLLVSLLLVVGVVHTSFFIRLFRRKWELD
jgi:hypothetical protein